MAPDQFGHMRASDQDRDRTLSVLQTAFAEGRLTKDEYDTRAGQVLSAKVFAQLGAVTADLVVPPAARRPATARRTSAGLARYGRALGFAGLAVIMCLITVAAIRVGHVHPFVFHARGIGGPIGQIKHALPKLPTLPTAQVGPG